MRMSVESGHPLFRFSRRNRPRKGGKVRRCPVFSRSVRRFCGRRPRPRFRTIRTRTVTGSPPGRNRPQNERKRKIFHLPASDGSARLGAPGGSLRPFAQSRPAFSGILSARPNFGKNRTAKIRRIKTGTAQSTSRNGIAIPPPGTTLRATPKQEKASDACRTLFLYSYRNAERPFPVPRPRETASAASSLFFRSIGRPRRTTHVRQRTACLPHRATDRLPERGKTASGPVEARTFRHVTVQPPPNTGAEPPAARNRRTGGPPGYDSPRKRHRPKPPSQSRPERTHLPPAAEKRHGGRIR